VINTGYLETTPTVSSDGLTLIFGSDRIGNVPGSGTGFNGVDLWMTTRSDPSDPTGWTPPIHLGPSINSIYEDSSPFLSRDGLALYFTSNRPIPNPGDRDGLENIWVARRNSLSEPFGVPVSLGIHFTEFHNVVDPCLSADGSTLLFASRGRLSDLAPFIDLWQVSILPYPPLSISVFKAPAQ